MLYIYSFRNITRGLGDIFSTVIKDEPCFISNFKRVAPPSGEKHEWLEDDLYCRSFAGTGSGNTIALDDKNMKKVHAGTLFVKDGDTALWEVKAINGSNIEVAVAAPNGSASDSISGEGVFRIVSNSQNMTTAESSNYNCIQTFQKEIVVPGSALQISTWGNADNQLNRQTSITLSEFARDLNRVAIFGRRIEASAGVRGEAGGLYSFATGEGALEIDAKNTMIDSFLLNDASRMVMSEGGEPMQILCSPGQARVLSCENRDRLQVLRSDDRRGAYVAVIVNEINGRGLTVIADPDIPDSECWVVDQSCFGMSVKSITDVDHHLAGFDGIRRTVTAELTFEFKNAKQRCCRIKGLNASTAALAEIRRSL